MERETEEEADADERREAAIASSASLRPDFKPKSGLTESQLAKFQGLGDWKSKSHKKAVKGRDGAEHIEPAWDPISVPIPQSRVGNISSMEEGTVAAAGNKRQKLYWGLDILYGGREAQCDLHQKPTSNMSRNGQGTVKEREQGTAGHSKKGQHYLYIGK
ncbi:hypothetical protein OROHE_017256 [Orobanche hederae]